MVAQKCNLTNPSVSSKAVNPHLYGDVQRHGWSAFRWFVVEEMPGSTQKERLHREAYWIRQFNTTDREFGYNLRLDTQQGMVVHPETRKKMSENNKGELNRNYGNKWTDEMKESMSEIAKSRHAAGKYGDEWKQKIGKASSEFWGKNPEKKKLMAEKVRVKKQKYIFKQYTKEGDLLKTWDSISDILTEHPDYHRQAIYSVCGGHKSSYRGFVWKKELKI